MLAYSSHAKFERKIALVLFQLTSSDGVKYGKNKHSVIWLFKRVFRFQY